MRLRVIYPVLAALWAGLALPSASRAQMPAAPGAVDPALRDAVRQGQALVEDPARSQAPATNAPPGFDEVFGLVKEHLAGLDAADLNSAAVQGLLAALAPKVSLVGGDAANPPPATGPLVSRTTTYDDDIGYFRVKRVEEGLARLVHDAFDQLSASNRLEGLVLDLRYAGGADYAAAAAVADLFVKKERPLLDWGNGMTKARDKDDAITAPVVVLVNRQTAGSAEALAGAVRETGTGLVLGSQTAGQAMVAKEYPLKNGQRLRIATAPIRLGDGSTLSTQGIKPDIAVNVNPAEERSYYVDAFRDAQRSNLTASAGVSFTNQNNGTNRTRRTRFNEAELVRERKQGLLPAEGIEAVDNGEPAPEVMVVRDPALARALDFLKGLAVVRRLHS